MESNDKRHNAYQILHYRRRGGAFVVNALSAAVGFVLIRQPPLASAFAVPIAWVKRIECSRVCV